MDIISHGLWGAVAFGRKTSFRRAMLFGMLPDALAFSPYLFTRVLSQGIEGLFTRPEHYPVWVKTLYNTTHSLVIAGVIFYLLCQIREELGLSFLAWPLHILLDIPTHSAQSFPTKLLFPLSQLYYDGVHWRNPFIMLGNWAAIALVYYFLWKSQRLRPGYQKS